MIRGRDQFRAVCLKVSGEFTVPLCHGHHRQLHQAGDEAAWWDNFEINALEIVPAAAQASQQQAKLPQKVPHQNARKVPNEPN